MKKKLAMAAVLILLALAAAGCSIAASVMEIHLNFPNAEKYAVGGAEIGGPVENLDVDWTEGILEIRYADQDRISISETAKRDLKDAEKLRWYLDGTTLRVQYAASGTVILEELKKHVTVTLPIGWALKKAELSVTSGEIAARPLYAEEAVLSATSGAIRAECAADKADFSVTSGEIEVTAAANEIRLNASSGDIHAVIQHGDDIAANATSGTLSLEIQEGKRAKAGVSSGKVQILSGRLDTLEAESTSGNIDLTVSRADSVAAKASSGTIRLNVQGMPKEIKLNSTSGDQYLTLPEGAGFTADTATTSGQVAMRFPAIKEGNRYVAGNGGAALILRSTSGDITVSGEK